MARRPERRTAAAVTPDAFARVQRSLRRCTDQVQELKREVAEHVRRVTAMQAEIDHLREKIRS